MASSVAPNGAAAAASVHSPPLPQHLKIVALESFFTPTPPISVPAPHTFELVDYPRTAADQVLERIKDADIIMICIAPITAAILAPENTPRLRMIAVMASGTDSVDLDACKKRGVRVLNSPHCNTAALAEHVAAMYLSTRRSLLPVMRAMARDEWATKGSIMSAAYTLGAPPPSCRDETVAIIGYGGVGQAVEATMTALGMKVIVSGRKSETDAARLAQNGRVPFAEALARATVLVVCCPRLPDTLNLLGAAELATMRRDAILINVSRGHIVSETALVAALREGRIAGAGVDVFDTEPASRATSPVVEAVAQGDLNLVATAHTAWVAASTRANYQKTAQENIEQFVGGNPAEHRIKA